MAKEKELPVRQVIIQGINFGVTLLSSSKKEDMDFLTTRAMQLWDKVRMEEANK